MTSARDILNQVTTDGNIEHDKRVAVLCQKLYQAMDPTRTRHLQTRFHEAARGQKIAINIGALISALSQIAVNSPAPGVTRDAFYLMIHDAIQAGIAMKEASK